MSRSILPAFTSMLRVCRLGLGLLLIAGVALTAEAAEYPEPLGLTSSDLKSVDSVEVVNLDPLDVAKLVAEDRATEFKEPLRFAVPKTVNRGLENGGHWEQLPDGREVWRIRLEAEGAAGLAPVFDQFHLPPGALLHIYDPDGERRVRPFSAADNRPGRELWAPVLPVDALVVELVVPSGAERRDARLYIGKVLQAYRDLSGRVLSDGILEKSDSCNVDVACTLGQAWPNEVQAVARITLGFGICSGFLVNNTSEDGRPLFMTARHCDPDLQFVDNLITYWNYENSVCRTPDTPDAAGPGDDNLVEEFTTGATLLATDERSDFLAAELATSPDAFGVYYLGWDSRKIAPQSSVSIHHPDGEEKRISLENDPSFFDIYPDPFVPEDPDSHIQVVDWDEGTTERGSSGSPLIDETTRRAIGQLHGGFAACDDDMPGDNGLPDWYGAMWRSFELGLREVLDPTQSGAEFVDGLAATGATCINDATTLCLNGGRFEVKVDWRDFENNTGPGQTVGSRTDDSGLFWFFGPQNWELLIKVLDACDDPFNRYWVFFAATTNVEYTLTVTDTETDESKTYSNPLGNLAQAVTDTDAFATCP